MPAITFIESSKRLAPLNSNKYYAISDFMCGLYGACTLSGSSTSEFPLDFSSKKGGSRVWWSFKDGKVEQKSLPKAELLSQTTMLDSHRNLYNSGCASFGALAFLVGEDNEDYKGLNCSHIAWDMEQYCEYLPCLREEEYLRINELSSEKIRRWATLGGYMRVNLRDDPDAQLMVEQADLPQKVLAPDLILKGKVSAQIPGPMTWVPGYLYTNGTHYIYPDGSFLAVGEAYSITLRADRAHLHTKNTVKIFLFWNVEDHSLDVRIVCNPKDLDDRDRYLRLKCLSAPSSGLLTELNSEFKIHGRRWWTGLGSKVLRSACAIRILRDELPDDTVREAYCIGTEGITVIEKTKSIGECRISDSFYVLQNPSAAFYGPGDASLYEIYTGISKMDLRVIVLDNRTHSEGRAVTYRRKVYHF